MHATDPRSTPGSHTSQQGSELLTVSQAADYLQLSPSSIRSYIRQGRLKAFRVAGLRKVLIPRTELRALREPATADSEQSGSMQRPAA